MNIFKYLKDYFKAKNQGVKLQAPDSRDYQYSGSTQEQLPSYVNLSDKFSRVRDQESSNACTGFATVSVVEYLMNQHYAKGFVLSPLFNWYYAKALHGYPDKDEGVWLRNSLKALFSEGVVDEKSYPFTKNYLVPPSLKDHYIVKDIIKWFLNEYTRYELVTPSQVRQVLANDTPVVFALPLNNSFYGNTTGIISSDKPSNSWHAMVVVGYDEKSETYIVRNSWGDDWGYDGYCFIPYLYLERYAMDLWAINYKGENISSEKLK